MNRTVLSILLLTISILSFAQLQPAPKFTPKAQKSILSLNTYDKNGELMKSGTAFFVSQNGDAIADYALFKNAYKAIAIDASGKQYDVDCILGADDTYSIVRFHVNTKGNSFLTTVKYIQPIGSKVYAINFSKEKISVCPQSTIESLDSINAKYAYYKFAGDMGNTYVGSPVFNETGELIGILHSAMGQGIYLHSYAMDIRFREELKISAIQSSSSTMALKSINIPKGIPDTVEEGLVYAYFKSRTADNDEYLDILNRMIAAFPENAELYQRRSVPLTDIGQNAEADADLQKYLSLAADKAIANYTVAQGIYNKLRYVPEPAYDKWTADVAVDYINKAIELESAQQREESAANMLKFKEQKALILSMKKDYDGAITLYEEINTGEHRSPAYYYAISTARESRGDSTSLIIAELDSAINMFGTPMPTEAANYVLRRGQVHANAGEYRKAVIDYNQYAYLLNSQVSDVFYYDRSQIEVNARMFQQALDDINSAVSLRPDNPLYLVEKGAICLRVNMIDDCITACTEALRLNADLPVAYRIRGYAYVQKQDMKSARKDLEKATELGDESAKEILKTYVK